MKKPLFYLNLILIFVLVFQVVNWVSAAFTEPTTAFPGGSPAAPLDTSSQNQIKDAELMLKRVTFIDSGSGALSSGGGICLKDQAASASPSCKLYWNSIGSPVRSYIAACDRGLKYQSSNEQIYEQWCGASPAIPFDNTCVPFVVAMGQAPDNDPDAIRQAECWIDLNENKLFYRIDTTGGDGETNIGNRAVCGAICGGNLTNLSPGSLGGSGSDPSVEPPGGGGSADPNRNE